MQGNSKFSLDADLEQRIEGFARAARSTPNEIVRRAFEEYEAKCNGSKENGSTEESAYEAFRRTGLIGAVKGGPTDLSTNPKYLEGMGRG